MDSLSLCELAAAGVMETIHHGCIAQILSLSRSLSPPPQLDLIGRVGVAGRSRVQTPAATQVRTSASINRPAWAICTGTNQPPQ